MATASYKAIFDYLVNNHDIHNPAQPSEIVDATGISKATVYRLLQKKANGASPDETISAGIFLAPETFRVVGYKPSQTYYADPKRIKDANLVSTLASDRVDLGFNFDYFIVQPVMLTPSMLELMQSQREVVNTVLDSTKPWLDLLESICTMQRPAAKNITKGYDDIAELYLKCKEHYKKVNAGEETLDKELLTQFIEEIQGQTQRLQMQAELFKVILANPLFDTTPFRLFAEDTKKPTIAPPVIKERK